MEKLHLYEIAEAFREIEDKLEDDLSLQEYLDAIKMDLVAKVDNIVRYRRSLELTSEALSSEIDRLSKLKKHYDTTGDKLKNYLSYSLQKIGKDKLETEVARISFRKSVTIEILAEAMIPAEYKKIKTTESIDKTAIKNAIQSGLYVTGAELKTNLNLQIK